MSPVTCERVLTTGVVDLTQNTSAIWHATNLDLDLRTSEVHSDLFSTSGRRIFNRTDSTQHYLVLGCNNGIGGFYEKFPLSPPLLHLTMYTAHSTQHTAHSTFASSSNTSKTSIQAPTLSHVRWASCDSDKEISL